MTKFKTGWVQNTCFDPSSYILESAQGIQQFDDKVYYAMCVRDISHYNLHYQSTEYFVTVRIMIWWWLASLAEIYSWFYLQNKVALIPSVYECLVPNLHVFELSSDNPREERRFNAKYKSTRIFGADILKISSDSSSGVGINWPAQKCRHKLKSNKPTCECE
jgi:hypothetical protein